MFPHADFHLFPTVGSDVTSPSQRNTSSLQALSASYQSETNTPTKSTFLHTEDDTTDDAFQHNDHTPTPMFDQNMKPHNKHSDTKLKRNSPTVVQASNLLGKYTNNATIDPTSFNESNSSTSLGTQGKQNTGQTIQTFMIP